MPWTQAGIIASLSGDSSSAIVLPPSESEGDALTLLFQLRTHAEREVKNLREDLLKKKIQVTLTKKETQSVMAPFLRDSFYFVGPI